MKSKRLVALSVFGEEEEDDDVVLTSLFQKLIYFRSHSAAIGCNCTTVQIVFCLKFAQSIRHPFSSVPFFLLPRLVRFSFDAHLLPPSKKNPFQHSYRQGHFRCSYPQGHRLSKTATVDRRRACPSGCPRTLKDGVTASRRKAALGTIRNCFIDTAEKGPFKVASSVHPRRKNG